MSAPPYFGARDRAGAMRLGATLLIVALLAINVSFGVAAEQADASHNLFQVVDTGGADDAVGQSDLTAFASDYTHLADGHIDLRWNWDVSSLSGANTGDACALHDIDNDTKVDGALCVTIGGNPAVAQSVRQYLCSGGTTDRCTNPSEIVSFASTCSVAIAVGADPFNGSNDAQASCSSVLADYGGNTHFTGVCSYPSREPNSNPSDCVMNPGTGLFIVKDAGADTTTPFTFTVHDNTTGGDLVLTATGADRAFAAIPNNTHTYTITEAAQSGWQQTGATCSNGNTPPTVTLTPATPTVTCTFTNAVHHDADMAITKADSADPVHEGEGFDYTLVATNNGPDQADAVTVTDVLPAGTTLSSAVVTGGSGSCTGTTTVDCTLGDLADGASRTITIGVTVDPSAGSLPADLSNTATVATTATDTVPDNDSATEATTVDPTLTATKSADVSDVPEDGGDVTFTFSAVNHRLTALTLTSFVDSVFGDLAGQGSCATPQTIAAGATYTCGLTVPLVGDAGTTHVDTVIAGAADAGGNEYSSTSPDVSVGFTDVASSLEVTKTADLDSVVEPGGPVTFTAVVENTSPADAVTITDVADSDFGDVGDDCTPALPAVLQPGDTLSCEFTRTITGDLGDLHTDTVTASGTDDDAAPVAQESNEVTIDVTDAGSALQVTKTSDIDSVPETGGDVTFRAEVENTSPADAVTVSSVVDSDFGAVGDDCTPALPAVLAPGDTLSCEFTRTISGAPGDVHLDTVTVQGTDDDGVAVSDESGEVAIDITDTPSSLEVVKSTDVDSVVENGGPVTFTATAENTSAIDVVTVEAVDDDVFGDLAEDCTPALPAVLAPGDVLTCEFTRTVEGNAGDTHVDTITVDGTDDDGQPVGGSGSASVAVTDAPSSLTVTKAADVDALTEPGGDVTFTAEVENTSVADDVTVSSMIDSAFGAVTDDCTPALPIVLAPGDTLTCEFTRTVTGDFGDVHVDTVTASGTDDDGDAVVVESDEVMIDITDAASALTVTKTADVSSVPEPGGPVAYTIIAENTSSADEVAVTEVVDDRFGEVAFDSCAPELPTVLSPGDRLTCQLTGTVNGNFGQTHTNTVTVAGFDDDGAAVVGEASEDVAITDTPSSLEITKTADVASVVDPGGAVTFTVTAENTSPVDQVTVTSVDDDVFGDVADDCAPVLPAVLDPGDVLTCAFTRDVLGDPGDTHVDTVTVTATDDDGADASGQDTETVDVVSDAPSSAVASKSADVASVPEPGGAVTFTATLENTSSADTVTIATVVDDVYGDVADDCAPSLPADLAPGELLTCTFTRTVSGGAGDVHVDTVTFEGTDDDGDPISAQASESVDVTDAASSVAVTKTAGVSEVLAPGAPVAFTVTAANTSTADDVTLEGVSDLANGQSTDVSGACTLPVTLAPGETFSCTFTRTVTGAPGTIDTDTATVTGTDDDGNAVSGEDTETVDVVSAGDPDLRVTKSDDDSHIIPGTPFAYGVDVANVGPVTATGTTHVVDALPSGLTLLSTSGAGWDCTASTATVVDCANDGDLASGASYARLVIVTDVPDGLLGAVTNTAVVSNPDDPTDDQDSVTTDAVPLADLEVQKTADTTSATVGDQVTYTIRLSNTGPSVARDVVVAERLPAGLALVSHTARSGTFDPGTGDWTVARLGVGHTTSLVLVVTVLPAGPYTNEAFVEAAAQRDPDSSAANEFSDDGEDDEAAAAIAVRALATDPPPDDAAPATPDLPRTGSEPAGLVAVALVLLTSGAVVLALSRRRRPNPA